MENVDVLENLMAICEAMKKIKPIDQTDCFKQYYTELLDTICSNERFKQLYEEIEKKYK